MSRRSALIVLVAAIALMAGGLGLGFSLLGDSGPSRTYRGSIPPAGITLPDFTLPDYTGETVRMSDQAGKVVLVTFLDSQCTESCPIIASQIAQTMPRFSAEERQRVVALAITTDPMEDTPTAIRSFLRKQHAEGKLHYLLGSEGELRNVWNAFHILPSEDTGIDELHSAPVRIFDLEGVWVSSLHAGVDLTPQNLVHDVRVALAGA
jgi:protein SCO1